MFNLKNKIKKFKKWANRTEPNGTPLWKSLVFQKRLPSRYVKFYSKYYCLFNLYFNLYFNIKRTACLKCNPKAETEIHSLVCNRHLRMYIFAIKSFLRFYSDVVVIVHDDGSLTKKDKNFLKKHIIGIKIKDYKYTNNFVGNILRKYPYCNQFREKRKVTMQIFDYSILAKGKFIGMDSDILFLDFPNEIINWIKSKKKSLMYTYEEKPCAPKINLVSLLDIKNLPFKFSRNLCGGFFCGYKDVFNLDLIEPYCKYVIKNCTSDLYRAQTITSLCFANSSYKKKILPLSYQNSDYFNSNVVFKHYFNAVSNFIKKKEDPYTIGVASPEAYLEDLRKVIKEIKSKK
jgi:hypothetical protein